MCQAIAGRLERITGTGLERRGMVSVGGVERDVSIALVPHVEVGDWVIFHSGYALRRVDESEAQAVYEILGDGPADVCHAARSRRRHRVSPIETPQNPGRFSLQSVSDVLRVSPVAGSR